MRRELNSRNIYYINTSPSPRYQYNYPTLFPIVTVPANSTRKPPITGSFPVHQKQVKMILKLLLLPRKSCMDNQIFIQI